MPQIIQKRSHKLPDWIYDRVTQSETGCWFWLAGRTTAGYGRWRDVYMHRHVWELANGQLIPKDYDVCHTCDNPSCINPNHLWAGSRAENVKDMLKKKRESRGAKHGIKIRGEKQGQSKLTEDAVRAIRIKYQSGIYTLKTLGREFGVSWQTIGQVTSRRNWKHVK